MKTTEPLMEKAAIPWLDAQDKIYLTRPKRFPPQGVTTATGGYPTTLGKVADVVGKAHWEPRTFLITC